METTRAHTKENRNKRHKTRINGQIWTKNEEKRRKIKKKPPKNLQERENSLIFAVSYDSNTLNKHQTTRRRRSKTDSTTGYWQRRRRDLKGMCRIPMVNKKERKKLWTSNSRTSVSSTREHAMRY